MKRTILAISLLLACSSYAAKTKNVMADENGVIVRPANFVDANNLATATELAEAVDGAGLSNLVYDSFSDVKDLTSLHILEYPQQSNGEVNNGVQTLFAEDWYHVMDTNAWLNISHGFLAEADTNNPTSSLYSGPMKVMGLTTPSPNHQYVGMGSEVGFDLEARNLFTGRPKLFYTRVGHGGMPITYFEKGGDMYAHMLERVALTQSTWADSGVPYGIVWGQGETPAAEGVVYYDEATNLISDLRADLGNPDLRVFFTGMNDDVGIGHVYESDLAMRRIADEDPLAYYITSKMWEQNQTITTANEIHYSSFGHLSKGAAIAQAVARSFTGVQAEENINAENVAANRGSFSQLNAGSGSMANLTVHGKIKTSEVNVGGSSFKNGGLFGPVVNESYDIPADVVAHFPLNENLQDIISGNYLDQKEEDRVLGWQHIVPSEERGVSVYQGTLNNLDYLEIANPITMGNSFSIAWWSKHGPTFDGSEVVFGHPTASGHVNVMMTATTVSVDMRDSSGVYNIMTCYLSSLGLSINGIENGDDEWHRYMFTSSSDSNCVLYVDGIPMEGSRIANKSGTINRSEVTLSRIGNGRSNNGANKGFNGQIYDLTVFSSSQTPRQAIADYARYTTADLQSRGYSSLADVNPISNEDLLLFLPMWNPDIGNSGTATACNWSDGDRNIDSFLTDTRYADEGYGFDSDLGIGFARFQSPYNSSSNSIRMSSVKYVAPTTNNNFTVTAWYRPLHDHVQSGDENRYICAARLQGNYANGFVFKPTVGSGNLNMPLFTLMGSATTAYSVISVTPTSYNTWVHLAVTVDRSTGVMKIYQNGVLDNEAYAGSNIATSVGLTTELLYVGKINHTVLHYGSAEGDISCFSIWKRALRAEEIKSLYEHPMGIKNIHYRLAE